MTTTTSQPDLPLGGLPPATRDLLRDAPLQVAVAEVRWARTGHDLDEDRGLELRDAAAGHGLHLAHVEPVQQQQVRVEMSPEGPVTALDPRVAGVRLTTADGLLAVTVFPDSLVVQANAYRRYRDSLAPQIAAAASAVRDVMDPHLVQRVGLRYVNRLAGGDTQGTQAWRGRIEPSFLGPLLHPELGTRVVGLQQQVEMQLEETSGAIIRHGPFRDATAGDGFAYLLDIDVFDTRSARFDLEALAVLAQALNRSALSLFQQIVTREWRDTLGPYTEAAPTVENAGDTDQREEAQ
ncbi:uncharacterized protein (TIGR04255 family) [Motilibacter rhizosphaerae]|uniref:Uncharacterized protein (TIGR04255 family) n=1 Tax=Motilibacter rhizosphaerae TaxID=598652 RepID=A0A4V2F506_9ACTN|nr:TIGR04255 family protein [Motilibacter rhizosphaerae]RZS91149.1 uncharacterized protein (TIGR04255 family) [Motilibacter rhizosphaerae]